MIQSEEFYGEPVEAAAIDFDAVVEQFYQGLYQFAFGLTGNASDAADLTQETYRVLLLKSGQIRDPQKIKSWLFTTLYREFLGRRRHLVRFPELDVAEAESELPAIDAAQAENLDANVVISALQTLEEKYRAPLIMFYLEELSYKEIAAVLEVPIGTVMSRLSRGKQILRQRLESCQCGPQAGAGKSCRRAETARRPAPVATAPLSQAVRTWCVTGAVAPV